MDETSILKEVIAVSADKETDINWTKRLKVISTLKIEATSANSETLPKIFQDAKVQSLIKESVLSERSRLSIATLNLIEALAYTAKVAFQPVSGIYLKPVLKLSSRAKKVYVSLSRATLIRALEASSCYSFISILTSTLTSPSKSLRETAAIGILTLCKSCNSDQASAFRTELENFLKFASVDQLQTVREYSKSVWEVYKTLFPDTYQEFANTLTFMSKKYLSIPIKSLSTSSLTTETTNSNMQRRIPPIKHLPRCTSSFVKPLSSSKIPKCESSSALSGSQSGTVSFSSGKSEASSKSSHLIFTRNLSKSFSSSSSHSTSTAASRSTLSSSKSFIQSFGALKTTNIKKNPGDHLKSKFPLPCNRPTACGAPFKVVRPSSSTKL